MEKYNKIRRIIALLTVVVIVACIVAMVVMACIGSKLFLIFLFLAIALPVILWIPLWFMNILKGNDDDQKKDS